jgi:hypothetical protein
MEIRARAAVVLLGTSVLVWAAPLAGLALAGEAITPFLQFPPRTVAVPPAPFAWGAFIIVSLLPLAAAVLYAVAWARVTPAAPAAARNKFPLWGWIGVCLIGLGWALAWSDYVPAEWRRHTFTPLWLGYVITINALTWRRSGRSLLTHRTRLLLWLFPASAVFWWTFEHLNQFAHNWYYTGFEAPSDWSYFLQATAPFSTVLPAVASTWDWLRTYRRFESLGLGLPRVAPARPLLYAGMVIAIGGLGLAGIGLWPQALFSMLWLGPLLVLLGAQKLFLGPTLLGPLARGDWRPVLQPAAAALVCGFFWEMWNWGSLAQWHYAVPYVQRFYLFEMPLLGYAGYLPFGLECAVVADLVARALERRGLYRN